MAILTEFKEVYRDYQSIKSASKTHRKTLQRLQPHLVHFKSNRSCFCCFLQMPEKVMVCGHALCDTCIKIYGRRSHTEKNTYELTECLLCGVTYAKAIFHFVPPTAGIRVLTIDGGGVRGIIPLKFLEHIERLLKNLCCPLRDFFDLACGTSAGESSAFTLPPTDSK